jgi:hypothetical protein
MPFIDANGSRVLSEDKAVIKLQERICDGGTPLVDVCDGVSNAPLLHNALPVA